MKRAHVRTRLGRVITAVAAADAIMIGIAVVAGFLLKFTETNPPPPARLDEPLAWLLAFGWVAPAWIATLVLHDAYSTRQFAHGTDEFKTVLRGSFWAAALVALTSYLVNNDMSRGFYLYTFCIGTALLLAERYLVRLLVYRLRARDELMHRVVAVGSCEAVGEMDRILRRNRGLGYSIVGVCLTDSDGVLIPGNLEFLGGPGRAVEACKETGADTLLVAGGTFSSFADLRRIGWELQDSEVDLVVVPSLIDVAGPRIHMRPVAGLPLMHVDPPQVAAAMKWGKAVFDRVSALVLVVLLSPLMLAVAAAIKIGDHGPVFFRQERIGLHGNHFSLWKFRSMVHDAAQAHETLVLDSGRGNLLFKLAQDPRATRVGQFIRRYSLDELPQLLNVLAGEMSLVGPRPQVAAEVAAYGADDHRRLLVRPGITGLWQVSGRSELDWDEAVRLDLYYVDNWSMMGDLVILAKTVRAVLFPKGAY